MFLSLIYTSNAVHSPGDPSNLDILREAQQFNAKQEVTGFLVRDRMRFIQVLEGESAHVNTVYAKIERDPRHYNLKLLGRWETPTRAFEGWDMRYSEVTAPGPAPTADAETFFDYLCAIAQPLRAA